MSAGYRGLGGADGLGMGMFGSKKVLVAFGDSPLPAGVVSYVQVGGVGGGEGGGAEGGTHAPSQSTWYSTYTKLPRPTNSPSESTCQGAIGLGLGLGLGSGGGQGQG